MSNLDSRNKVTIMLTLCPQNGARLKSWAGPDVGYGYINNITYNGKFILKSTITRIDTVGTDILLTGMYNENVDWPIVLDACYFNIDPEVCAAQPSRVNITNILFKNIHGITSGKEGKDVASLVCSPSAVCENIRLEDIDLRSPENPDEQGVVLCDGIADGVGVPCVAANSTAA